MIRSGAALLLLLTGCAAQLDTGYSWRSPDPYPRVWRVSGQVLDMRKSGPTLGLRGVGTIDYDRFTLRNAIVGVGYVLRPLARPPLGFGFEGTLDLGLGEPTFVDYPSIGGYVGGAVAMPYRIAGGADFDENNYQTIALLVDLVPSASGGIWTPPAGQDGLGARGDLTGQLGVRFTFGTDLGRAPRATEGQSP